MSQTTQQEKVGLVSADRQGEHSMVMTEHDIEQRIAMMERQWQLYERYMKLICSKINPVTDIVLINGRPCKTGAFAEKARVVCGGTFEFVRDEHGRPAVYRHDYEDKQGKYYIYEVFGRYTHGAVVFESSASFSSRHKFFGREPSSEGFRPTEDVDEMNIRTAAVTECQKKCIFGALGIGQFTPEMCEELGINLSKAKGHTFNTGTKGGNTDDQEDADKRAEIERICQSLAGHCEDSSGATLNSAIEVLRYATTSENFKGWNSFGKISKKGLDITLKNVREFAAKNDQLPM